MGGVTNGKGGGEQEKYMVSGVGFSLTCPDRLLRLLPGFYVHVEQVITSRCMGIKKLKKKERFSPGKWIWKSLVSRWKSKQ